MEAVSYRVTGMTCGGCVRALTNAVHAAAPAASVAVDLPKGTLTVGGLEEAGVRRAVEDAGFGFVGRSG
jgi:copper chaperone